MRVIVGLGNPGAQYAHTRHNVGFMCVDRVSRLHNIPFSDRRQLAAMGTGCIEGQEVVLAKPRTFMNRSGEAVRYLLQRFSAKPSDLVVIYDDMDLPLGKIRIRPKGSSGGHRGVESIIGATGTQDFARIRVGVGRPLGTEGAVNHVLARFSREEEPVVQEAIDRVAEAVRVLLKDGIEAAMNRFN